MFPAASETALQWLIGKKLYRGAHGRGKRRFCTAEPWWTPLEGSVDRRDGFLEARGSVCRQPLPWDWATWQLSEPPSASQFVCINTSLGCTPPSHTSVGVSFRTQLSFCIAAPATQFQAAQPSTSPPACEEPQCMKAPSS